jgi:hypothetical protein
MMLSDCRVHAGDLSGGLQAARNASEMAPDRPRYLERVVDLLGLSDRNAEASTLKQRVQILRDYRARVDRLSRSE